MKDPVHRAIIKYTLAPFAASNTEYGKLPDNSCVRVPQLTYAHPAPEHAAGLAVENAMNKLSKSGEVPQSPVKIAANGCNGPGLVSVAVPFTPREGRRYQKKK